MNIIRECKSFSQVTWYLWLLWLADRAAFHSGQQRQDGIMMSRNAWSSDHLTFTGRIIVLTQRAKSFWFDLYTAGKYVWCYFIKQNVLLNNYNEFYYCMSFSLYFHYPKWNRNSDFVVFTMVIITDYSYISNNCVTGCLPSSHLGLNR